jgi:hypothetical protein
MGSITKSVEMEVDKLFTVPAVQVQEEKISWASTNSFSWIRTFLNNFSGVGSLCFFFCGQTKGILQQVTLFFKTFLVRISALPVFFLQKQSAGLRTA